MNLIQVIQQEIQKQYNKPKNTSITPTRDGRHKSSIDAGLKPENNSNTDFSWVVSSYIYDRSGDYIPNLNDFINEMYPAPQESNDSFNAMSTWITKMYLGYLVDKNVPQYTNRRYSAYIQTYSYSGMESIKAILKWKYNWKIVVTSENGEEYSYTTTSTVADITHKCVLPIPGGHSRIDILLYADGNEAEEFSFYMDLSDIYSNRVPIPQMRMATAQGNIYVNGDGAWHNYRAVTSYTPAGATISFSDNAETTTVNFNDNSDIPGADTIVRTAGVWSEFTGGNIILVSGSVSNDGYYETSTVVGDTITLIAGDKLQDEDGISVTIRTNSEITDSATGFSNYSAGDIITVSGTVSNNTTYIIESKPDNGTFVLDFRSIVTNESNKQATISKHAITHFYNTDGVNFKVRDVMIIKEVIDLRPIDINTFATIGHEHQTLGLELTDPSIDGNTEVGTAHSHGITGLSISGDTGTGTIHGHGITGLSISGDTGTGTTHGHGITGLSISGDTGTGTTHGHSISSVLDHTHDVSGTTSTGGDPAHDHTFSDTSTSDGTHAHTGATGNEAAHTHNEGGLALGGTIDNEATHTHNEGGLALGGTIDNEAAHTHNEGDLALGGTIDNESAHTHPIIGANLTIGDPIIIGGVKTGKDTLLIELPPQIVDSHDISLVDIEAVRDGNGFIEPAIRAYISKSLTFNKVEYTAAGIQYKEIVNTNNTIAFVQGAPDSITDSASGFGDFTNGMTILVSGSLYNDGFYTINTAVAGTLTLTVSGTLTNESAGYTCVVHGESYIYKATATFGVEGFQVDTYCRVSGTMYNDKDYFIHGVSATKLSLYAYENLVNETTAGSTTIKGESYVTDGANGFLTAGFENNMPVTISGTANNNGTKQVDSAIVGKLTFSIDDDIVDETVATTIQSLDKNGYYIQIKAASNKKYKINYSVLAWGIDIPPFSDDYP